MTDRSSPPLEDAEDPSQSTSVHGLILPLQAAARGNLARKRWRDDVIHTMNDHFGTFFDLDKTGKEALRTNAEVLRVVPVFFRVAIFPDHLQLLASLARHMILSMEATAKERNFASVLVSKTSLLSGSRLCSGMCRIIPTAMHSVQAKKVSEQKAWQALIHWIIVFSSCGAWSLVRGTPQIHPVLNSLCNKMVAPLMSAENYRMLADCLFRVTNESRPLLPTEAINALFAVLLRPLKGTENVSDEAILLAAETLFSCPAILVHINDTSREATKNSIFLTRVVPLLNARGLKNGNHSKTLNLMGNLIHLSNLKMDKSLIWEWAELLSNFVSRCAEVTAASATRGLLHWHPIFGNCSLLLDAGTDASLRHVVKQLRQMWSVRLTKMLFEEEVNEGKQPERSDDRTGIARIWGKVLKATGNERDFDSTKLPISRTAVIAHLYTSTLAALPNLRSDILAGLCSDASLIGRLWKETTRKRSSVDCDALALVTTLAMEDSLSARVHLAAPQLFADTAAYIIKILDDEELYEKGVPLPTSELAAVARFANSFCFRSIWMDDYSGRPASEQDLFSSLHQLCVILYERNSRRPFSSDPKLWIPGDVRSSSILQELEKGTPRGQILQQKMSHVVPLKDRMLLFRKYIQNEKSSSESRPRLITVVRTMIIEDGYRQLSKLSPAELRSTIRVKFINQQGLDEAGIDQDGVFKEYLELTLKAVFNPNLSLFAFTSAGQLHPSTLSHQQENHLDLFRFVGKMLAKAVYEGIVVDVQLAPVLLATLLGERSLCAFDELAQFDPELYRSLTYVKKASEEEVDDMGLTFSTDEEHFGKIVTVDIVPAGRTIQVTQDNKINYVHRMAHYRVFMQTKEQCRAFVEGFQASNFSWFATTLTLQMVVKPSWLFLFAPHELQSLISGQNSDIDLADLRRNVQYYGGFHANHRLIKWLWAILENDFSRDERRLFLKFVTSCSRGPLLGFASLEPPFSIRCVEVSDDQDTGDTLGSVIRGFLAMKKGQSSSRLPTASTCFNLLKLPNYNKKNVLLEKLRYAIHSETGFELS